MRFIAFYLVASNLLIKSGAFIFPSQEGKPVSWNLDATVEDSSTFQCSDECASTDSLLESMSSTTAAAEWAEMFGMGKSEQAFFALFESIRNTIPIGLRGKPFLLKNDQVEKALGGVSFAGFFSYDDLEQAVSDDFLDAGRGTTDNRKGWKMTTVSNPRGQSFEEARMTVEDVKQALEKGTVIFNSAGAHISKLAGPSLACTDATMLPNALNLYVTAPQKRTSAPPHTDKQDVVVVQTGGRKHWRVYSPPDPSLAPSADMFARGKGDDNMPLHALETNQFGCQLLLEATLDEGDILFIPAAFPHTTDTAKDGVDKTSLHLTFGLDTHIWDLDYLSVRRLAMKRCKLTDDTLGQMGETDNKYVGALNALPLNMVHDLVEALPIGLLEDDVSEAQMKQVMNELKRVSEALDQTTASKLSDTVLKETLERVIEHGRELVDIHRDMYLAAVEEGQLRTQEAAMTAHVGSDKKQALTPEQMQRLSVFRVKRYFDKIEVLNKSLLDWCYAGNAVEKDGSELPADWQFTLPVNVGDHVEADLGGAFFPATVTAVRGNAYDVQFFDGDTDSGLERGMIKLSVPPAQEQEVDTSNMTPKQLKRWKKLQEKKNRK